MHINLSILPLELTGNFLVTVENWYQDDEISKILYISPLKVNKSQKH